MTARSPALAIACERLRNQRIAPPDGLRAADLVRHFGAVQAQDYAGSLWALGLRLRGAREADIEHAIAARTIVRTWPMRGTLHYVPAEDAAWMLRLLTPRVIARSAGRYRQLGLHEADFRRGRRILERALRGGRSLTRPEVYAALERGGVSPAGQRGIHVLAHLAQQGLICFGARAGRQQTFVLLDEWASRPRDLRGDEALAALATRYFAGHGPASARDFAWWSGLPARQARAAIQAAASSLESRTIAGQEWWTSPSAAAARAARRPAAALLPPWDEYVVAYKDRTGLFETVRDRADRLPYAVGLSLVVIDGQVRGAWRRTTGPSAVRVDVDYWAKASRDQRAAVATAAARYARFLGRPLELRSAG